MILNDPQGRSTVAADTGRTTLDDLFRRTALRRPDAIALTDPPNREAFTDGPPRRLTYAEVDRMVSAIASGMRRMGLATGAVVGLQISNTVESVLTLLAVLRAGLIAMPLPLLWRQAEITAAFDRVGAHGLVVSERIGTTNYVDLAMQLAVEIFSVRFVCAFGSKTHDGVVTLENFLAAAMSDPIPVIEYPPFDAAGPGARLAVITWDVTADGLVPVARTHAEAIAGGLAILLEGGVPPSAAILSSLPTSSFAGLAAAVIPWLITGGTLALHHPFDPATFAEQCTASDTVIVPGVLATILADAAYLRAEDGVERVIGVWRAPERLSRAAPWQHTAMAMTDVQVFGEIGLLAARRDRGGRPTPITFGPVPAPRDDPGACIVAQVCRTKNGTVALGGPMVPRSPFRPRAEHAKPPTPRLLSDRFTDTGYACRPDAVIVTGAPPGLVSVGGYRFLPRELEEIVHSVDTAAMLAALPDALTGHRLAGAAGNRCQVEDALAGLGVNPLIAGAFRVQEQGSERKEPQA